MHSIQLSIVIPTYQSERTVERAILSALSIKSDAVEVIVVNDGSLDGTHRILDRLAAQDSRLIIISQNNSGRSAARNKGVEVASGKWIMFLDSDDYLIESAFPYVLERCENSNSPLVVFGMIANGGQCRLVESEHDTGRSFMMPASYLVKRMIEEYSFDYIKESWRYEINAAWARLYRRDLLLSLIVKSEGFFGPFPLYLRFSEDRLFNIAYLRLLEQQSVEFMPVDLYYWNYEGSQTCGSLHDDDASSIVVFNNIVLHMVEMGIINFDESNYLIAREVISQFQRLAKLAKGFESTLVREYTKLFCHSDYTRAVRSVPSHSYCCSLFWTIVGWFIGHGFARSIFIVCKLAFYTKKTLRIAN